MPGAFITFEGGEGAGKSTQARRLCESLRARGREVVLTREPGGSDLAERLRSALLGEAGRGLDASAQAILFAAARTDHVEGVIAPALRAGRIVVCDRFSDSTLAYQGTSGAPEALLSALEAVAVGPTRPDLTVIIDLPPEEGLRRVKTRAATDRFEEDDLARHEARREAFLAIAARDPGRCIIVDGTLPEEEVAARVLEAVAERLPEAVAA